MTLVKVIYCWLKRREKQKYQKKRQKKRRNSREKHISRRNIEIKRKIIALLTLRSIMTALYPVSAGINTWLIGLYAMTRLISIRRNKYTIEG